jgi:hypothetical protein
VLGREIRTLVNNETKNLRLYEVRFNAGNVSSGFYFYGPKAGNYIKTNKILLVK